MRRMAALVLSGLLWAGAVASAQGYTLILQTQTQEATEGKVALATWRAAFLQVEDLGDEEVQGRVNGIILERMDSEGGFQAALDYAREDFREDPQRFQANTYGQGVSCRATLQGERLLGLAYEFVTYTGGPHPWYARLGLILDLSTGEAVPPARLFREEEEARALVTRSILAQRALEGPGLEEEREALALWSWDRALLTKDGLRIVYDPGEVGPVAEGFREYTVDYGALEEAWGAWGGPADW